MDEKFKSHKFMFIFKIIGGIFGGLIIAVIMAFLFGFVVQYLWNWLMPSIFGLAKITYWQGFGIILLARIIFGFGIHHGHHGPHGHGRNHFKKWGNGSDCGKGGWGKWKYYDEYWHKEGKDSFEKYIERKEAEKQ